EGYWGFAEFEKQVMDMINCFNALEPNKKIAIEVDHSAGHVKNLPEGLHVANMNAKYGGKQRALRDSVINEECLGPENATMYLNGGKWSTNFVPELPTRTVDSKGVKQVHWERGWYVYGMSTITKNAETNISRVLSNLPDVRNERTALQHTVESRGHILVLPPKFHPEVAGVGIEYSWGMSKLEYRRELNDE
ncbi:unnamed protein product, partial [Ascophyllum nodosum]